MNPALAHEVRVHRAIGLQPLQLLPQVVGLRYDVAQYLARHRFLTARARREARRNPAIVPPTAAESERVERVCEFILRRLDEAQYGLIGTCIAYTRALQLAAELGSSRATPPVQPATLRQRFLERWLGPAVDATDEELVTGMTTCLWVARRLIALILASQGENHDGRFAAPYREDFHFYHRGTVYGNARTLQRTPPAEVVEASARP